MKIDKTNYRDFRPEELSEGLSSGELTLVETGIEALIEIIHYIAEAIANGPRIKRIKALEEFAKAQLVINKQILKKLETK